MDINEGADWATSLAIEDGADHYLWDGDGVGAGVLAASGALLAETVTLMEPLLYGDGSGVIENVHMAEPLPSWLYLGAPVRVQRRDSEGDLVATDYRGFVSHIERGESSVSYQLAGQAAGRAALRGAGGTVRRRNVPPVRCRGG